VATLTLDRIWVHRWDTGEAVSGFSARGRDEAYVRAGEVRTYGGGRQRSITTVGERGTYGFALKRVPRSTVETLRAWIGIAVQVRDHIGRRVVGVYFGVTIGEYPGDPTAFDIAISVQATSVDEA
jgi:hypothetical protein